MVTAFELIPEEAKIWVFPSSRKFYPQEIETISTTIEEFLNQWQNKNLAITCSFVIKYDRFIIITANDTFEALSLEAHDALTALILKIEHQYDVLLMDKINVCYKQGEFVQYKDLIAFKKLIKAKAVSEKTIVFNNMITVKEELEYNWEVNIKDSWLGRFI
jgi:archaellum biogenesis ATPase FlaH